jgi:hypothetical protein
MAKKPATARRTAKPKPKKKAKRTRWFDPKSGAPLINAYARKLDSFLTAVADGVIEDRELKEQEKRLVALMKAVEPKLDDDVHEQVTKLLCELTAYDVMQMMVIMQEARPETRFRG